MRMAKHGWLAAVVGVLVMMASCTDDDGNANTGDDTQTEEGQDLTLTDAQIARVLEVANEGEILLSQLALQQATDADVRDFADRMVREHTQAQQRMAPLFQAQGLQAEDSTVSRQLQEEVQRMADALRGMAAERFDLAFMDAQVAAHARTAMVGDALLVPQVQNQALSQELRTQRQAVQRHLQDAAALQADLFQ